MNEYSKARIYTSKQEKIMRNFSSFFLILCLLVCFFIAIFNAMFFSAEVVGTSMWPTLNNDPEKTDIIYASSWFNPQKGDIIIVNPIGTENDWIKRLIAVGGDTISFGDINRDDESAIYLNGEVLDEPYLIDKTKNIECINDFKQMIKNCLGEDISDSRVKTSWLSKNSDGNYQITLPEDYCIYLGDNRNGSYDCSELGPQKLSTIVAKVMIVVPYGYDLITYTSAKLFGKVK